MILVDTSVWIDFFNGKDLPHVATLESLISQEADIAICGIILTEVLQGISNDKEHKLTQTYLQALVMLEIEDNLWLDAAEIYRNLRKRGLTVRKINDCIIAATALHYDCVLLHNDKDFTTIQLHYLLKTNC
jgi:predicted nucleic acid-binding protein